MARKTSPSPKSPRKTPGTQTGKTTGKQADKQTGRKTTPKSTPKSTAKSTAKSAAKSTPKPAAPAARPRRRKPARTAVMVLGMHRSGTSALAGVMARMGCDEPATAIAAHDTNAAGFYESDRVREINDRILASAGIKWLDWQPFPESWMQSHKAAEFAEEAGAVIAEEFGDSRLFVLKDPRICRLAPFWRGVLEEAGIRPAWLHTHRHPLEVADSLQARDKLPRQVSLLIWLRHVLDAEAATRGQARVFTSYARLLEAWAREVERIAGGLDLALPRGVQQAAPEVEGFLSTGLRHSTRSEAEIVENPLVGAWFRDTFEVMQGWAAGGRDSAADRRRLDAVAAEFSAIAPVFAPLTGPDPRRLPAGHPEAERLKEKLAEEKATRSAYGKELARLKARLETGGTGGTGVPAPGADADLAERLRAAEERVRQLEDTLAETRSALTQRQHEAEQTHAELTRLRKHDDPGHAEALEGQLAEMETQLQARYDELAQLARLMSEMEEARSRAERDHRKALESAERRAGEAAARARKLEQVVASSTADLKAGHAERERLEYELAMLRQSTSWKITAPIRRLMRVLGRG